MKLAIVGSTDLAPAQTVTVERMVKAFIVYYTLCICSADDLVVISGGAAGVDSIAEQIASRLYLPPLIYYPAHSRWEPQGYKARNLRIAEECDELLCIRSRQSKTYGSGWTADRAEELGKPTWRYYV